MNLPLAWTSRQQQVKVSMCLRRRKRVWEEKESAQSSSGTVLIELKCVRRKEEGNQGFKMRSSDCFPYALPASNLSLSQWINEWSVINALYFIYIFIINRKSTIHLNSQSTIEVSLSARLDPLVKLFFFVLPNKVCCVWLRCHEDCPRYLLTKIYYIQMKWR